MFLLLDGELVLKMYTTGGQFNLEERELHINTLQLLKAALYGLRLIHDGIKDSHIFLLLDNALQLLL